MVEAAGRKFIAAYDSFENCLGGSCRAVETLLDSLGNCRLVLEKRSKPLATIYALEEPVELIYDCPDTVLRKIIGG